MAVSLAPPTSLRTGKAPVIQAMVFPAPLKGMDARVPLAVDALDTCLWAINMVPTEYSMRVRKGYSEWQIGVGAEIRTVIGYIGSAAAGTGDKLFVATEDGIYDCTTYGGSPTQKVAFASSANNAGYGVYTHYVDEAGNDLMFYADGENGLFAYDPSGNSWAQHTGITEDAAAINTFTMANVNFVMVHKLRIWLIEKDSNHAWYLPIRSATGSVKEFFFGSKFRHGGELVGLFNWTIDGGLGRDDHLVAISRGGDVIPYTGEDPADGTTWMSTGTFHIGQLPAGHRVASEYGGEVFVLSKYGVTGLSGLMRGAEMADPYTNQVGHKVARLLRQDLANYGDDQGWDIRFATDLGSLLINTPQMDDGKYRQYVYNIATEGWGLWRDLPFAAGDLWKGALMIGDADGRVLRLDQNVDGVTIAGSTGSPINWFLLTAYSHCGTPASFKRAHLIRANFVAESAPLYQTSAHYDYRTDEPSEVTGNPSSPDGAVWDTGLWGTALWNASVVTPWATVLGASGMGRSIAVALVGQSTTQTDLVSIDVMWDVGGLL